MKKSYFVLLISAMLLLSSYTVVFAHGDEPEDEGTSAESTDHAEQDAASGELTLRENPMTPLWAGLAGLMLFAGGLDIVNLGKRNYFDLALIGLVGISAFIHLGVGWQFSDWLLILNGLGYAVLGVLIAFNVLPQFRSMFIYGLIGYTLVTIIGYFVLHDHVDLIGVLTKIIEGFLILAALLNLFLNKQEA